MKINEKIEKDLKSAPPIIKKIVKRAILEGLKDGGFVYVKTWSPNKGWFWERNKFNYYHKVYGLYPNISNTLNHVGPIAHNNYSIRKTKESKIITF